MKLMDILSGIGESTVTGNRDREIENICYDSRKADRNSLFVAIKGFKMNGHDFSFDAYRRGTRVFVVEDKVNLPPDATLIRVPSSRKALAHIGGIFFNHPSRKFKVIGITGTNGKTTITYLLQSILREAGVNVSRLSTINYDIGGKIYPASTTTPESLDLQKLFKEMLDCGTEYVVMEVSSHALTLHRVDSVEFEWAVFTNLSLDHLDFHQTMQRYLEAKSSLFERMSSEKKALINIDDPYGETIINKTACQVLTYGLQENADYSPLNWRMNEKMTFFQLMIGEKKEEFQVSLPGVHNVYNALAAVGIALEEGIPLNYIKDGLKKVKGIPGRLEPVENRAGLRIYVDYAHTPHSLENALNTLGRITPGRLIVVFGCAGDRDPYKRPVMGKIAFKKADYTVITSDNPRSEAPEKIISQIEEGMREEGAVEGKDFARLVERKEAIRYGLSKMKKDDTLLIAGKGHERIQIFKDAVIPFDDVQTTRGLLKESHLL